MGWNRAYLESLLEGVPLPATRKDLIKYAKREAGRSESKVLKDLPSQRYWALDEVGEALAPVQPRRARKPRVPKPESDLPPGGPAYGYQAGGPSAI